MVSIASRGSTLLLAGVIVLSGITSPGSTARADTGRFLSVQQAQEILLEALEQAVANARESQSLADRNRQLRERYIPDALRRRQLLPNPRLTWLRSGPPAEPLKIIDTDLGITFRPETRSLINTLIRAEELTELERSQRGPETARRIRALFKDIIYDHHGFFFEKQREELNATHRGILRMAKLLANCPSPRRCKQRVEAAFRFTVTDNLGDGSHMLWLANNLDRIVKEPRLLDLFDQLGWLEDVGIFGSRFLERWRRGEFQHRLFGDIVELEFAILQSYDEALEAHGLASSDRIGALAPATQQQLLERARADISLLIDDTQERSRRAQAYITKAIAMMPQIRAARLSLSESVESDLRKRGVDEPAALFERLFVFSGLKPGAVKGVFASWMAKSIVHSANIQLELTELPDPITGKRTMFILAIPNGRGQLVRVDFLDVIDSVNEANLAVARELQRIHGPSLKPGRSFGRSAVAVAFPPNALLLDQQQLLTEILAAIGGPEQVGDTPVGQAAGASWQPGHLDCEGAVADLINARNGLLQTD